MGRRSLATSAEVARLQFCVVPYPVISSLVARLRPRFSPRLIAALSPRVSTGAGPARQTANEAGPISKGAIAVMPMLRGVHVQVADVVFAVTASPDIDHALDVALDVVVDLAA